MGDVDDSRFDELLYGKGNSKRNSQTNHHHHQKDLDEEDLDTPFYSNYSDSVDEELDPDLQETTLSHIHYVPTGLLASTQSETPTSPISNKPFFAFSSSSSSSSSSMLSHSHPPLTKTLSSEQEGRMEDSRYHLKPKPSSTPISSTFTEQIDLVSSSDSEASDASSSVSHDTSSSSCSQPSAESGEIIENVVSEVSSSTLPQQTIDTEETLKLLQKQEDQMPKKDYTNWDTKVHKMKSRYWLPNNEDRFEHQSKRSRRSSSPDHELNVIIPCLKCGRDHDRKFNCKVIRCQGCMRLNHHETFKCPFFRFAKCTTCRLRFHNDENCPLKNSSDRICKNCPNVPKHLPEYCPRLWRVYIANNNPKKEPREITKSCAYCGHPHFFDGCTQFPKQKKFQSPWNRLPLRDRQATVLDVDDVEKYTLSEFVLERLREPHPYIKRTSTRSPHSRTSLTRPSHLSSTLHRSSSYSHSTSSRSTLPHTVSRSSDPTHYRTHTSRSSKHDSYEKESLPFPPTHARLKRPRPVPDSHSSSTLSSSSVSSYSSSTTTPATSTNSRTLQDMFPDRVPKKYQPRVSKVDPLVPTPWHSQSMSSAPSSHHHGYPRATTGHGGGPTTRYPTSSSSSSSSSSTPHHHHHHPHHHHSHPQFKYPSIHTNPRGYVGLSSSSSSSSSSAYRGGGYSSRR